MHGGLLYYVGAHWVHSLFSVHFNQHAYSCIAIMQYDWPSSQLVKAIVWVQVGDRQSFLTLLVNGLEATLKLLMTYLPFKAGVKTNSIYFVSHGIQATKALPQLYHARHIMLTF